MIRSSCYWLEPSTSSTYTCTFSCSMTLAQCPFETQEFPMFFYFAKNSPIYRHLGKILAFEIGFQSPWGIAKTPSWCRRKFLDKQTGKPVKWQNYVYSHTVAAQQKYYCHCEVWTATVSKDHKCQGQEARLV